MNENNTFPENISCRPKGRITSYVVTALSYVTGGISIFLFVVFLFTGLPNRMELGLNEQTNLYFDTLLCLLFFFQHSMMLRRKFRKWLSGFIPQNYLGALFSIFSGIFLFILMIFWQKSTSLHFELDGVPYWLMRALFFLSIIGFYFTLRSLRFFDPLGIGEIFSRLKGGAVMESFLTVRGTYRWVRHPLYFFSLMMIWAQVSVTTDRLLFNVLWTFWIIIGIFLEERDLIDSFGDEYRNYQREVPMLIPCRRPGIMINYNQRY